MNLGWINDTEDIGEIDKAIILHEFGHALGLGYEHQSPSCGGVLALKAARASNKSNVEAHCR